MSSLMPELSTITVPIATSCTTSATLIPRWFVEKSEFNPAPATYQPLVNGEEAFKAVYEAIAKAEKTVDIVCWGFQPSMYFIRDACHACIGELLRIKASAGVQVRILGWEMPFNAAGVAGEANLPGKGVWRIKNRALQSSTEDQYAYDRDWFDECSASDGDAASRASSRVPVFVSRGFSWNERAEVDHCLKYEALDKNISRGMRKAMRASLTHHQKSVLVDYELPGAVGFVMGHNMLDEYWDNDRHSALNRTPTTQPEPYLGPRGVKPRQDISCKLSGPVLYGVHKNFADAWCKETGENLLTARNAHTHPTHLKFIPGSPRMMVQVLRTQMQVGEFKSSRKHKDDTGGYERPIHDIQSAYLVAANNVTQFIYIENQYFRWPPLADLIKQCAAAQTCNGRDPAEHGSIHLFVVTNDTNDGVGMGTAKTQEMLESLGRADTIPQVTKLRRIKEIKADMPPRPRPDSANDTMGHRKLAEWEAELNEKIKPVKESILTPMPVPGLKIHVCSLVAPDSPVGQKWTPVYIHSKLMIVNDVYTTQGSANINTRSMMGDSELNICHEHADTTQQLRRRLWNLHTGNKGGQDDPEMAFKAWENIIKQNKDLRSEKLSPYASLVEFYYGDATYKDLD
ncbi:phospholipase D-like domain-containing protein [Pseudomonas alliivorans]|nr:phospholipase D-like domain-containing protein [Pseudomonas alliivorans]MEE4703277.1 phospholipase D-like domain-containing protein [Pseudomonas alliivorans]MEE4739172.1 phospholipase D-like domain-containing protein [Pseudomonas alliivorans]